MSVHLGMICRCGPEGAADADALVARVRESLQLKDDADFISALVMELNWKHSAYVELVADQWFGVRTVAHTGGELLAYAECDRVEDGLAACYEELEKKT